MKRIAIAVALLAALGAACAKAGPESPRPRSPNGQAKAAAQAPVAGLSDGLAKAAMVEAGLTNFTGITAEDLSAGLTKAAMAEAGMTNFTGVTPRGELPSGAPHPHTANQVPKGVQP
jgi:hypothetical protein